MSRLFAIMIACFSLLTMSAFAADADPTGLWLTQNKRSVVSVEPCRGNKKLTCGYIHWIIKDGMQQDTKNPDPKLRSRAMCGLPILFDLKKDGTNSWSGGKIYKADEGTVYNGSLKMRDDGKLNVRGYVGIPLLGKSQVWERVSAKDYPKCRKSK